MTDKKNQNKHVKVDFRPVMLLFILRNTLSLTDGDHKVNSICPMAFSSFDIVASKFNKGGNVIDFGTIANGIGREK